MPDTAGTPTPRVVGRRAPVAFRSCWCCWCFRRDRPGRWRHAAAPRGAVLPGQRDPVLRLGPLGRVDPRAGRGRPITVEDAATADFERPRHRPLLRRRDGVARAGAARRRRRRGRDRQLVGLADGSRRAAGRLRGQPARGARRPRKGIIANPNCTTMAAMPVLKPLHGGRRAEPPGRLHRTRPSAAAVSPASTSSTSRRARSSAAPATLTFDGRPRDLPGAAEVRRARSRSTCCRSPASSSTTARPRPTRS